jgi:folate-dependent phosphoribosylglycinamide formyltransferase PurN
MKWIAGSRYRWNMWTFKSGETLEELTERIHEVEHLVIVKGTGLAIVRLWEERRKRRVVR